ncbi:MAG: DNA mismatch repair protein MutS [Deltaproteobacteria bacterium]|nr:MAG: DNA mismatch repair protein MutS [Deltaproteobacteria bacterium]
MTPMFQQYHELKASHPGAVLFFRMGDFYEMFYEDAELAARELELTLTARNKGDPNPIPMAGVPHHAADGYIRRMVEAGYRVAIAEQVEDPALAKGLVRREVVRVVTPAVALDPTAHEASAAAWLMAVEGQGTAWGIAALDVSTGAFRVTEVSTAEAALAELQRLDPREVLLGPACREEPVLTAGIRALGPLVSQVEDEAYTEAEGMRELCEVLGVTDLMGFGVRDGHPAIGPGGAAVRYARHNMGGALHNLHSITPYTIEGFMVVDDTTRRNLELVRSIRGGTRKGTLLGLLDQCCTAMGSRALRDRLSFPLLDPAQIEARQSALGELTDDHTLRKDLRAELKSVADIERIGARVTQGTANARDLALLRRSLFAVPRVLQLLDLAPALAAVAPRDLCTDVAEDLATWLVEDPPQSLTEGGLLRRGAHDELDELVRLSLEGIGIIAEVEERERDETGISSLKIRKNKVFGYYIEVTRAHLHRVPDRYMRKQTLTNAERYITPELKELEDKVLGADERRKELEYALFAELRARVARHSARLLDLGRSLAQLDVHAALAQVAVRHRWTRPEVDTSTTLVIEGGRHPVVEAMLDEERFVPNDVFLDTEERKLVVLTGPNMSGKSTVMRQVALIALLAQIGSFVPADRAVIGVCDRIFTRVGAADDVARGQSTFMVEMAETAAILHGASPRSLVVLDEIGRGTSTYDGLSIAWAVAEDLAVRVGCRTMFATHYHELCDLAEFVDGVANQSVAVSEWGDEVVFLRRLKEGGASKSYGIQCARLAGLPTDVVERARSLLTRFEKHAPRNERQQLSLFGGGVPAAEVEEAPAVDELREKLATLDPDGMSPRDAHAALYLLRSLL